MHTGQGNLPQNGLINTYIKLSCLGQSDMYIRTVGEQMLSKEGITQGGPLAMAVYALSLQALITQT